MCALKYGISSAGLLLYLTTWIRMNGSFKNGAAGVERFICLSGVAKFK